MLDFVIGTVTNIFADGTFQVNVTHIGAHNKNRYNNFETVTVAQNTQVTSVNTVTVWQLQGKKVRCHVRYRDIYNRLYADVVLEQVV